MGVGSLLHDTCYIGGYYFGRGCAFLILHAASAAAAVSGVIRLCRDGRITKKNAVVYGIVSFIPAVNIITTSVLKKVTENRNRRKNMDYYGKYKYELFGVNDKNHNTEIPVKNILKESITKNPCLCDIQYIIFINPKDSKILVNTDYKMKGDKVSLCIPYTRILCDTLKEYKHLSIEYIEKQAYGSWMDGAK